MAFEMTEDVWGVRLRLLPGTDEAAFAAWVDDIATTIDALPASFHVLVELTDDGDAVVSSPLLQEALAMLRAAGAHRVAVLVDGAEAASVAKRSVLASGAGAWQRVIDVAVTESAEPVAMAWLLLGDDPDVVVEPEPKKRRRRRRRSVNGEDAPDPNWPPFANFPRRFG